VADREGGKTGERHRRELTGGGRHMGIGREGKQTGRGNRQGGGWALFAFHWWWSRLLLVDCHSLAVVGRGGGVSVCGHSLSMGGHCSWMGGWCGLWVGIVVRWGKGGGC
jgi:hypothetical protein